MLMSAISQLHHFLHSSVADVLTLGLIVALEEFKSVSLIICELRPSSNSSRVIHSCVEISIEWKYQKAIE